MAYNSKIMFVSVLTMPAKLVTYYSQNQAYMWFVHPNHPKAGLPSHDHMTSKVLFCNDEEPMPCVCTIVSSLLYCHNGRYYYVAMCDYIYHRLYSMVHWHGLSLLCNNPEIKRVEF